MGCKWRNRTAGARTVAVALLVATMAGPAGAVLVAEAADQSQRAVQELRDAIAAADSQRDIPRLDDPALAGVFEAAFPAAATQGGAAGGEEIGRLLRASHRAHRLAQDYLLVGVGDGGSAAGREQAARNFIVYLPEIARLYDFRVRVHARLAEGVARMQATMPGKLRDDPKIAQGVATIASETRAVIETTLTASGDVNIDPAWRIARMTVLLGAAPAFSALFDIKAAQVIADRALALAITENDLTVALLLKNFALAILR